MLPARRKGTSPSAPGRHPCLCLYCRATLMSSPTKLTGLVRRNCFLLYNQKFVSKQHCALRSIGDNAQATLVHCQGNNDVKNATALVSLRQGWRSGLVPDGFSAIEKTLSRQFARAH